MAEIELGSFFIDYDVPIEQRTTPVPTPVDRTYFIVWVPIPLNLTVDFGYLLVGHYYRYKGRLVKASKVTKWFPNTFNILYSLYVPDFGSPTTDVSVWVKPISIFGGRENPSTFTVIAAVDTDDFTVGWIDV